MMDFSQAPDVGGGGELIPHGQLAFATITYKGLKQSKAGGEYLDLELTINEGQPYARRKVFTTIGNPFYKGNSEKYREMGLAFIKRILEASRWGRRTGEFNGEGFAAAGGYIIQAFSELHGVTVAVKIKVEKSEGYQDKNQVADYLTPNPKSDGHKDWIKLCNGQYNNIAQQPAPSAFGVPTQAVAATAMTWGTPAPAPAQPATNAAPSWMQQANGDTPPF